MRNQYDNRGRLDSDERTNKRTNKRANQRGNDCSW